MDRPLPHLWIAHVEGAWPDEAATWLDAEENERLGRFIPAAERRRRLVAWSLRRWALTQVRPGIPPSAWRFTPEAYGKPALAAPFAMPPLHHNLSHGGDYAAVLIAESPCGVDIEAPPRGLEAVDVAFSPEERAAVAASPDPLVGFLQIWVAKETVLKLTGLGFSQAPEAVSMAIAADGLSACVARTEAGAVPALVDAQVRLWPLRDGHWLGASIGSPAVECEPRVAPWQRLQSFRDQVQS